MPAPLTIIIPTYNAVGSLGPCLASIFAGVEAGLVHQVIFADGGSDDNIELVAQEVGAELVTTSKGRGTQLAAAAATAQSEWMLFLHADTRLSRDWVDAVQSHIRHRPQAGYFRLQFDASGLPARFVSSWANQRSWLLGLPYGDQGMLIKRSLYSAIGGYPDIPLMEDVAIARKLRGQLRPLSATATTSAIRYQEEGWILRGWRNLTTLVMYFAGVPPAKLAKRYTKPAKARQTG